MRIFIILIVSFCIFGCRIHHNNKMSETKRKELQTPQIQKKGNKAKKEKNPKPKKTKEKHYRQFIEFHIFEAQ
jgi:hypothetical protein